MSQLQAIACRLRALAQDASPLSVNVQASARQLEALAQQVESLSRSGVNTGPLMAALQQAQAQADAAAAAAAQVRSQGVSWADHLARGGGTPGSQSARHAPGTNAPRHTTTDADRAAFSDYTGGGYLEINQAFRGRAPMTDDIQQRADALSGALSKLPPYSGMTWRGTHLSKEQVNSYVVGGFVTEPAFTSTSSAPESAFDGNTRFLIYSKNGKDVSGHSILPHESEVLYDKGSVFYVVSNEAGSAPGSHVIVLKEV